MNKAFVWDITTRQKEQNKQDSGVMVHAKDITQGIIYEKGGGKNYCIHC